LLSPLLFVIAIISLTRILRHCDTGYQLGDSQSKINHLLFMVDLKLYRRNDCEIESLVHTVRILVKTSECNLESKSVLQLSCNMVRSSILKELSY